MRRVIPLLLSLALPGCAAMFDPSARSVTSSPSTTRVNTAAGTYTVNQVEDDHTAVHVIMLPLEQVWEALPAAYASVGVPGGVIRHARYTFGNPSLVLNGRMADGRPSRYLDCGKNPIGAAAADTYTVEAAVFSELQAMGETVTRLVTRVEAVAKPRSGGGVAGCVTSGRLEKEIQDELDRLLHP